MFSFSKVFRLKTFVSLVLLPSLSSSSMMDIAFTWQELKTRWSSLIFFRVFPYYFFVIFFSFCLELFGLRFFLLRDKTWTLRIRWPGTSVLPSSLIIIESHDFNSFVSLNSLLLIHPLLQQTDWGGKVKLFLLNKKLIDPQFFIYYMSWTIILEFFWH